MIKGIYNENEFYYENYWKNKLPSEIKNSNSQISNIDDLRTLLKSAANIFWDIKGISTEDETYLDCINNFYKIITESLGFTYQERKFETKDGNFSSFLTDLEEINIFGCTENETGDFDQFALSTLELGDDESRDDRPLVELINEELENENSNKWSIVLAPNSMYLLERSKWLFGRFIKFDWDEIFGINDSENYNFIIGLCHKKTLLPESGQSIHDGFDDESHRHAFGVTTQLREGVRESIELIVNEVLRQYDIKGKKVERNDNLAKDLTHDALFYVYRLIFMLYLEAQGNDSDLLPLKSEIYREGYTLDKLLEVLENEVLEDTEAYEGTFLYDSLEKIFALIYNGFNLKIDDEGSFLGDMQNYGDFGFLLNGIKSELFNSFSLKHIGKVPLSNGLIQKILGLLTITKDRSGSNIRTGRVSYSKLGVNQLGAVYEGLLSYNGYFADEDLYALKAKNVKQEEIDKGKSEDKIFLASKSTIERHEANDKKLHEDNYVKNLGGTNLIYRSGSFVYRLSGRDRQKSASYYTPDELTKSTVKNALNTMFENNMSLEDLWDLKILEPAMGSGAFLSECIVQLADKIFALEEKNNESKASEKNKRIYEIRHKLIVNNIYGVDLNETAVELARFTLWLTCIGSGQTPPQLKNNIKSGNSLHGASFVKNSDGFYPWFFLPDTLAKLNDKYSYYDEEGFSQLSNYKSNFSQIKIDNDTKDLLTQSQVCAENHLENLQAENDNALESYSILKSCGDVWASMFFVKPENINYSPKNIHEYLTILNNILKGEVSKINIQFMEFVESVVQKERFFHWALEFPVAVKDGGFDLIIGNPPWVNLTYNEAEVYSDIDAFPLVLNFNKQETNDLILANPSGLPYLMDSFISHSGAQAIRGADSSFKAMGSSSPNTYKFFDLKSFELISASGIIAFIHEEGCYEDVKSKKLREVLYSRLQKHFSFVNQKKLFDIGNTRSYSINIFGPPRKPRSFIHIGNLFVPSTIEECLSDYNGQEEVPGVWHKKDWDTRGHKNRLIHVDEDLIDLFRKFNNDQTVAPNLINLHSVEFEKMLQVYSNKENTLSRYLGEISGGGLFEGSSSMLKRESAYPDSLYSTVLAGPNILMGNYKGQSTLVNYTSHRSYEAVPLSESKSLLPRTIYKINAEEVDIDENLSSFTLKGKKFVDYYRIGFRRRIDIYSERCMYLAILPKGVLHIDLVESVAVDDNEKLLLASGLLMSLFADGLMRMKRMGDFRKGSFDVIPFPSEKKYLDSIKRRVLLLNTVGEEFEELWLSLSSDLLSVDDQLTDGSSMPKSFSSNIIEVDPEKRTLIQNEIDVLVLLSFGVKVEEFSPFYKVLFYVAEKYNQKNNINWLEHMKKIENKFIERGW